jgi:hypothetical protein
LLKCIVIDNSLLPQRFEWFWDVLVKPRHCRTATCILLWAQDIEWVQRTNLGRSCSISSKQITECCELMMDQTTS